MDVSMTEDERAVLLAKKIVVVSGSILGTLIPMAIVPSLPQMAQHLGGGDNDFHAKIVMSAPAISFAIAAPLAGVLATRVGLRSCLTAALLAYLVFGVMGFFVADLAALVTSRIGIGMAGGAISALTMSLAGDFAPDTRNRLLGFSVAAGGIASILALSIGGYLVDSFSWNAPFLLYAFALPVLALVLYSISDRRAAAAQVAKSASIPFASLWLIYLTMFILSVGIFTPSVEGPFLLAGRTMESATSQGLFLSVKSFTTMLASIGYGWIARYISERGLLTIALASVGGGLMITGMFDTPPLMIIGFGLTGVGSGLALPLIVAIIIGRTDEVVRARAVGLNYTAVFVGQFMTPIVLEPIKYISHSAGTFLWTGAFIAALSLIFRLPQRAIWPQRA